MTFFNSLLLITTAAACVRALPTNGAATRNSSLLPPYIPSPTLEGYSDGFYHIASTTGPLEIAFTNGPAGEFDLTWVFDSYNVEAGKGWNPGSRDRIINYSGAYQPNGVSYLWVHGWTTNPLIEYFIVESNNGAEGHPYSGALYKGRIRCDGQYYEVRNGTRWDITVDGVRVPVPQFWSIRLGKVYPGLAINQIVNTTCHFDGWKGYGLELGTEFDYQVVSVESYYSRGFANLTVSDGTVAS